MSDSVPDQATSTAASTSNTPAKTASTSTPFVPVHTLILDAGPILSLTPLRGMAERFIAPPQVIAELRDEKARQYWDRIQAGLIDGVNVEIRSPDAISLTKVIAFAQKTGDYAVLSKPDLAVLALTYALDAEGSKGSGSTSKPVQPAAVDVQEAETESPTVLPTPAAPAASSSSAIPPKSSPWGKVASTPTQPAASEDDAPESAFPALQTEPKDEQDGVKAVTSQFSRVEFKDLPMNENKPAGGPSDKELRIEKLRKEMKAEETKKEQWEQVYAEKDEDEEKAMDGWNEDESDAGEWITPDNVNKHKAEDLGLLPITKTEGTQPAPGGTTGEGKKKRTRTRTRAPKTQVRVACFTGDFAVQNVLIQMGLGLVGEGGKRIKSVKSWVLRCHACFKLCKDPSKKFCPNCGGPTLIRASITTHAPTPADPNPRVEVHLKQNFQYRTRGTVYPIPAPKMGSSKTPGDNLILREDQKEFQRGLKMEQGRKIKEDRELERAVKLQMEGKTAGLGSWNDPDWLPEIMTTGSSGKGRRSGGDGLPTVGYGRKNPNEARRRKK